MLSKIFSIRWVMLLLVGVPVIVMTFALFFFLNKTEQEAKLELQSSYQLFELTTSPHF